MSTSRSHIPLEVVPHGSYVGRKSIVAGIPGEILSLICNETEDFSRTSHDPLQRKYAKNVDIMAFSQVCRAWHSCINGNPSLWKDVAFDVRDVQSIKLAHHSLGIMEKTDAPFSVYARLYGGLHLAVEIFARLQPLAGRITHFEYFGDLGECGQFLNFPARNLRHLSGSLDLDPSTTTILSMPIFSGHLPRLRSLAMSPVARCAGWTAPLVTVESLELTPPYIGHSINLTSLFNLLRGLPQLRSLKLFGFGLIEDDIKNTPAHASLPSLETLDLNQSDIQTVLAHLSIPKLQNISFYGSSYPPGYSTPAPVFRSHHLFSRLTISILEQEIEDVFIMAGAGGGEKRFWIQLTSSSGRSLDVRMCWPQTMSMGWEGYVERSTIALQELITLSPGARVIFDFQTPFPRGIATPFLPTQIHLTVNCGLIGELRGLLESPNAPPLRLRTLKISGSTFSQSQIVQALGSGFHANGITLAVCDARGSGPSPDSFDSSNSGHVVSHSMSLLADALSELQF